MTLKKLMDMTPEEAAPIIEAWRTGDPLERYAVPIYPEKGEWRHYPAGSPIHQNMSYRIPVTPVWVNWPMFGKRWKHAAKDPNDHLWLYETHPALDKAFWTALGHSVMLTRDDMLSEEAYKLGTCDWRDSLVSRPTEEAA